MKEQSNARRAAGALSTLTALATASMLAAAPAQADPEDFRPLAGTGSDTTQYVMGALGEAVTIEEEKVIGSYDAIPAGSIQTREGGPSFVRPNGSGNGLRALTASINPDGNNTWPISGGIDITGQLDFARSSSGPSVVGTDLTFIPFAKDAVSYAYSDFGDASVPSYLTVDDLAAIYKREQTTYVDAAGVTRTYLPRLPQTGSGTRQFFLQSIGVTEDQVQWIVNLLQENDGTNIDQIGELVPFSVASWIAQSNNVVPDTIEDNIVVLGALDDDFLGIVQPIVHGQLNSDFPFNRLVFNVVQSSRLTGEDPADVLLQQAFAGSGSAVCQATGVITTYGFAAIPNCGNTTTYKSGYVRS
jgi:ABC-type phosphate transport system substrate-binding protein